MSLIDIMLILRLAYSQRKNQKIYELPKYLEAPLFSETDSILKFFIMRVHRWKLLTMNDMETEA